MSEPPQRPDDSSPDGHTVPETAPFSPGSDAPTQAEIGGEDSLSDSPTVPPGEFDSTSSDKPGAKSSTAATVSAGVDATPPHPLPLLPADVPIELRDHARYQLLELLGRGGMGAVFKAEHRLMQRCVALKLIRKDLTEKADSLERFQREIRAAAKLGHPNIVAAYDAEQAGDVHFLVMEYVAGTSLDRLLAERGPLPVRDACDYVMQAAEGLQHAHERGMVHRDIKPQNLMLTPDGQVKILDFGLAYFVSEAGGEQLTALGSMMGTPDYMAPEQARDAHAADIRADIYSLGYTLYHLLTGQVPFPKGSQIEKVMAHIERRPEPITEFRDDVPPVVVRVFERMTAKTPQERFQTPEAVARALRPVAEGRHLSASAPPRNPEKTHLLRRISTATANADVFYPDPSGSIAPARGSASRLALISLLIGGGALFLSLVPFVGVFSVPFSLAGWVLGAIGIMKTRDRRGRDFWLSLLG
ncbi:MAG: serine/threonine-protein kinase, partial [Planctomycetaceae bacterium]